MHEIFLEAIREAPDDDTPRLVYADWLDEHDQPERAEFIRAQIQMTYLSPESRPFAVLRKRSNDLLVVHGDSWRQVLPNWARPGCVFQRGFVWHIVCTALQFLKYGATLMGAVPIRSLRISCGRGRIADLAGSPHLAGLIALDLSLGRVGDREAEALAASPHLRYLTTLNLDHNDIGAVGMRALAASSYLSNLTCLSMTNNGILAELAAAPWLTRLTTLDLTAGATGGSEWFQTLQAFLNSPHLPRPKILSLRIHDLYDEGAEVLAVSPLLEQVIALNLSLTGIGSHGIQALVNSPYLKNVRKLDLSWNPLCDAGARLLLASPHLDHLRQLDLRHCDIESAKTDLRRRFGKRVML